eukprot:TCONS_00019179-protein
MEQRLWGTAKTTQRDRQRYFESFRQKRSLINNQSSSSSDDNSDDEEWIQQLERDYGRRYVSRKTKWTRLEKILAFCLVITLFLIIFLLTALVYSKIRHSDESLLEFTLGGQKYCNTDGCVQASHRILTYADQAREPCDSFYDYACGAWAKENAIPSTHLSKWTSFTEVSDKNQRLLKRILDDMHADPQDNEALEKVRMFFNSCLRTDFIEKQGNASLEKLIQYVGSWALTGGEWNEERWSFGQALTRIHHLKSMPLFYMYVAADDRNSSQNIIQIQQSGITLADESFYQSNPKNDKMVKSYLKLLATTGMLLGGKKKSIIEQSMEVFEFEKKLASIYEKREGKGADKMYNRITVAELLKLCPAIPWLDYMNSMFEVPVKADEDIVVYTPNYLKKMSDLVIKTDRRIIANYMVWHLIKPTLPLLSKPYRNAALEFLGKDVNNHQDKGEESWKNCVTKTDSMLGFGTGYLFVKEMKKEGKYSEKKIKRMLKLIKEEFTVALRHNTWMDDVTKQRAIDKTNSIIEMIGYPYWIENLKSLENYYQDLNITNDPLQNYFNAREFYHSKTMERRGKLVRRNEWHMTPTEVNAYYNAPNNYIALPMGLLQPPFFSPNYPHSMNYGALGTIIAHELSHGFDSQGRNFDKSGNLNKWWSNVTFESFDNKTQCLKKHYHKYQKKNTSRTLAEDLADQGGLKIAHQAFKTHQYLHEEDRTLPAISLSSEQLFFLGYAQSWCTISSNQQQQNAADVHSDSRTRVDASLSNSEAFAKAFKCPTNSRMNPQNK